MENEGFLKSITYTSRARLDLTTDDLLAIHESARHINALEGISGLLIFDGEHFLQVVEGGQEAVDNLIARLRRDDRHLGLEVRDERLVPARSFPSWSMELLRVSTPFHEAKHEIEHALPDDVDPKLRALILGRAAASGPSVTLPC